jgi:hypothetical protein
MTMPMARESRIRTSGPTALATLVLAIGALASPAAAGAQEEAPPARQDATLVFEREVFAYPSFERRNPFESLLANRSSGPRFEQMRLDGIVYSEVPGKSIAMLSAGRMGAASPDAPGRAVGQSARVRVGERWGNVRIVEIRPTQIVVEVEEFGLIERRTMDLPPRGQGGSR